MASGKMPPISAILHALRRHCWGSDAAKRAMDKGGDPVRIRSHSEWQGENTSIVALCDLLEITAIPDEELSKVISELEVLSNYHRAIPRLVKKLKKS